MSSNLLFAFIEHQGCNFIENYRSYFDEKCEKYISNQSFFFHVIDFHHFLETFKIAKMKLKILDFQELE